MSCTLNPDAPEVHLSYSQLLKLTRESMVWKSFRKHVLPSDSYTDDKFVKLLDCWLHNGREQVRNRTYEFMQHFIDIALDILNKSLKFDELPHSWLPKPENEDDKKHINIVHDFAKYVESIPRTVDLKQECCILQNHGLSLDEPEAITAFDNFVLVNKEFSLVNSPFQVMISAVCELTRLELQLITENHSKKETSNRLLLQLNLRMDIIERAVYVKCIRKHSLRRMLILANKRKTNPFYMLHLDVINHIIRFF